MSDYWRKQTKEEPLFPDLIWSRPESKHAAGKLLIIGGNIHSFAAVGQAYQAAKTAGIGSIRIVLPDALQKNRQQIAAGGHLRYQHPQWQLWSKSSG